MSLNLMDQFKGLLTDAVIEKVADNLGSNPNAIQKGLTNAGGSILAAAMNKASSQQGAQSLFDMLDDNTNLSNINNLLDDDSSLARSGSTLADSLLSDNKQSVLGLISNESGLSHTGANSLLNIGSGMVSGILGQQKAAGGSPESLVGLLSNQGSFLERAIPSLGSVLGIGSLAGLTGKLGSVAGNLGDSAINIADNVGDKIGDAVEDVSEFVGDAADKVGDTIGAAGSAAMGAGSAAVKGGSSLIKKLLPIGILILLAIFLLSFLRSCGAQETIGDLASGTVDAVGNVAEATADAAAGAVDAAGNVAEATVDAAAGAVDAAGDAAEATVDAAAGAVDAAGNAAEATVEAAGDVAEGAASAVGAALNAFGDAVGKLFSFSLPNGESIQIPEGGFEDSFLNALKNGDLAPGKYYIFDRLFFASGSSALNAESNEQISNAAKILSAYPDLSVTLRGHTDNQGSQAVNQALSQDRAAAVKAAIVALGVSAERIQTQGLAATDPVADNATAEGRKRNRRIDISVVK